MILDIASPAMPSPMTPGLIDAYMAHCRLRNLRPTTIYGRRLYLERAQQAIGKPLAEATPSDLEAWQRSLAHLQVKSQLAALSHVRTFYGWAVTMGLLARDPSLTLIRPRTPRMLPKPIPEDDLQLAIRAAAPDVRLILILAAYCGLRACEIAPLTGDAIHGDANPPYLEVRDGKGGHQRVVPLPSIVYDELRRYGMGSGVILRRRDGSRRPLSRESVSGLANDHLHRLGIPFTLHKARHRYGTRMYALSKDIRVVQEVMGHADANVTAGYIAYSAELAASAAESLARAL